MSPDVPTLEQAERVVVLRQERGLTQQALADRLGVDVGTVARWERGAQGIRPRNLAAIAEVLDVPLEELRTGTRPRPAATTPSRDLKTVEMVAWLAEAGGRAFAETYDLVCQAADRIEARSAADQYGRNYARAGIGRQELVDAVADYYQVGEEDGLYTAEVGGKSLRLSIVSKPEWRGLDIDLRSGGEQSTLLGVNPKPPERMPTVVYESAVARLADAEVNDRVLINNPMFRLSSVDVADGKLVTEFGLATFADYALRTGLMEIELVDALLKSDGTPVRDAILPSIDAVRDLDSYFCTGGPVTLFAAARPATSDRPADYALLVQTRGSQVMDIPGKLSTVPKGWHQPIGEAAPQSRLGVTLMREFEEELLGREDLEQMSAESKRVVDPLHKEHRQPAMAALLESPDAFQVRLTGFGFNLLSGTYEAACLIVIDDENWWVDWGHTIAGNWETTSIDCYSSSDADGIAALAHNPRWSNEGLFALIEGLRSLLASPSGRSESAILALGFPLDR
ncbi:MAG: helix-turn-helix domain-containing protein [Actinomycetota bacterium]